MEFNFYVILCSKGEPGPAGATGETGFPGSLVRYHLRSFQNKSTHIPRSCLWWRMYAACDWKDCCRGPEVFQDFQVIRDWKDTRWVSVFSSVLKEANVELWSIHGWLDREMLVYWGPEENQEPLDPRCKALILLLVMEISCRSRSETQSVCLCLWQGSSGTPGTMGGPGPQVGIQSLSS